MLRASEATKEFRCLPFLYVGSLVSVYQRACCVLGATLGAGETVESRTQALPWGSSRPYWGGRHIDGQLRHSVTSILSCLWAKCATAKAGSLEVSAVGRE